jgi:hypothetical protein
VGEQAVGERMGRRWSGRVTRVTGYNPCRITRLGPHATLTRRVPSALPWTCPRLLRRPHPRMDHVP